LNKRSPHILDGTDYGSPKHPKTQENDSDSLELESVKPVTWDCNFWLGKTEINQDTKLISKVRRAACEWIYRIANRT
jgi:uncharacterized protein YydD (DUF2326 family)